MLAQILHGRRDVDAVAGVAHVQDRSAGVLVERAQGFLHPGIAGVAEGVVLREDRDLVRLQSAHLDEIAHDGFGFLGVAGAIIEHIAVRRLVAQRPAARKCAEEDQLVLQHIGQDRRRGRGAEIADEAEHLVLFGERFREIGRARGIVAVVGDDEPQRLAVDPAGLVGGVESGFGAELQFPGEVLVGAAERRDQTKADRVLFSLGGGRRSRGGKTAISRAGRRAAERRGGGSGGGRRRCVLRVGSGLVLGDFLVTARQPFSEGAFRHAFGQGRIAKAVRRRDRVAVAMRRDRGLRGRNHRHDPIRGLGVERGRQDRAAEDQNAGHDPARARLAPRRSERNMTIIAELNHCKPSLLCSETPHKNSPQTILGLFLFWHHPKGKINEPSTEFSMRCTVKQKLNLSRTLLQPQSFQFLNFTRRAMHEF